MRRSDSFGKLNGTMDAANRSRKMAMLMVASVGYVESERMFRTIASNGGKEGAVDIHVMD